MGLYKMGYYAFKNEYVNTWVLLTKYIYDKYVMKEMFL